MMTFLAYIPVTPESLYNFLGAAALLLFIAEKLKSLFSKSRQDEPVKRSSYNFHCELNRTEHARIERELEEDIKALEAKHHALACQVAGIESTLEQNGARLLLIDQKQDRILENLAKK